MIDIPGDSRTWLSFSGADLNAYEILRPHNAERQLDETKDKSHHH